MYIVMTATAQMPTSVRSPYRRVAVVEVVDGVTPKMISERARGVIRLVQRWENLNVGKTERSAYGRALIEAQRLCDALNAATTDEVGAA